MTNTSKIPILLSALICPGVGQLMQKRWWAGTFFVIGFLSGFLWVMVVGLRLIAAYYAMAFDFNAEVPENTDASALIAPLVLALVFYVLNLFDMAAQHNRAAREKREEAFLQATLSMLQADNGKTPAASPQPPDIPHHETSAP